MIIAFGCDHAGFPLKARLVAEVQRAGHSVLDCGADSAEPSDYPDFARKVGQAVAAGQAERGLLVCGSGVGVSVAANKIPGVRAGSCHDCYSAHQGVEHDNMNVLCIGSRVVGEELAAELLRSYLTATFTNAPRHARRLEKMHQIEADARQGKFDG